MNRKRLLLATAALALLTVVVHLPSLRNGFIWDDDDHFTENLAMINPGGLKAIWSSLEISRYYPLTLTNFWLQRRLWGLNPLPYHAVNIAIHSASAVLVFLLLRRLKIPGAWVSAAIWGVHPVMVESVSWVTELKNAQSGFFFFLTLLAYLRFERDQKRGWFALSLVLFACALASKPSTVILPPVLLLIAWWQRGRWNVTDLKRSAPFFVMSAAMSLLTIVEQRGHVERDWWQWSISLDERLIVAGKALWFYVCKLLWPAQLSFVYPLWDLSTVSALSFLPLVAAGGLAFVLWNWRSQPWARACLFGLGYFVIALLPVLGFFDVYYFRYSFVADHFQYLAALGVIALVSAGVASRLRAGAASVLAVVVLTILGTVSWHHAAVFHDNETLWRDTLSKNSTSTLAHNNLGALLNSKGDYEAAEQHLREVLRLKPHFLEAHNNLGLTLIGLNREEEALREFEQALAILPEYAKTHFSLGMLYYKQKKLDLAEKHFRHAVYADPTMADAYYSLGVLLQEDGRITEAMTCYRVAVTLRPSLVGAQSNLAQLLAKHGKETEALERLRAASRAQPDSAMILFNLGLITRQMGDSENAIRKMRKVIEMEPKFADAYLELGRTFTANRRYGDAIQVFRRGLEVEPRHMVMGNEMAWVMSTAPDAAVRNAPQAIQIGERLAELTERKEPKPLETLAAAYAEAGRWDEALATAQEALALAQAQHSTNLIAELELQLNQYRQGKPYRLNLDE